uniref:C2H2-type domain-containing protein n=1 Tax=Xiphophorus couchianus TaxID=32473 RepID=A0A3B5L019_9TELE
MARLLPDLASFLSSVLPRGFALGPSLLREGSVGLWWVGHPLEAGAPLGTEGDVQRVARTGSDPLSNSSENDQSGAAYKPNLPAPPPVRSSSRLAAKPRLFHCMSAGSRRHPASDSSKLTEGQSKDSAKAPEVSPAAGWQPEVRERRYRCSSCGKRFYQLGHLRKHQFSHTDEKPFRCRDCGKNYTSSESFRAHQLSHKGERPFSCPHCEKTYGLKRDLKEHLVLHTGEKPYTCENCGKSFARRPSLRVHRLLHSCLFPTQPCSVCSKQLANPNSLRNHMKLHTGEKPHICQHCGKRFSQKGNLESHLRVHSGEKPFHCPECLQTFTQKSDLQRHMFTHTKGGFLCSYCGKSLRDPHSLRYHERLHTGERPHRCSICGKGYTMATKLRRHMRSSHLKEKPYSCSCGASYTLKQSLLRHEAQHRPKTEELSKAGPEEPVASDELPAGAQPELVEVVLPDGAEQCILVHGQQQLGELLILQEEPDGLCSVAETVEIDTV